MVFFDCAVDTRKDIVSSLCNDLVQTHKEAIKGIDNAHKTMQSSWRTMVGRNGYTQTQCSI